MREVMFTDQQLIGTYLQGDMSSIEQLILRHKKKVFTTIYLLVKDRDLANDIFQDTFIKVIDTLNTGKYNEEGKFLPWVVRIAHNLCIDHFRKNAKFPKMHQTEEGGDIFDYVNIYEENVEDKIIRRQSHQIIRNLINQLPEEQREVLVMRHYGGVSFKEISEATNVSINTALGRMRYALNNLRRMIKENRIAL